MEYGVDIEDSMLATIGNKISWIFEPMLELRVGEQQYLQFKV